MCKISFKKSSEFEELLFEKLTEIEDKKMSKIRHFLIQIAPQINFFYEDAKTLSQNLHFSKKCRLNHKNCCFLKNFVKN